MTEEAHRDTEPRKAVPGPDGSKLAPEGNSKARLFVPPDQEERRGRGSLDEPEDRAGAVEEEDPGEEGDAEPPAP